MEFIAEVKTKSPFGFNSNRNWRELFEIAKKYGDIISIHTNKLWGGCFEDIKKARLLTDKPILAKGLHENDQDIKKALDFGADYVLVVGRIPFLYQEKCIIEPLNLQELSNIPKEFKVFWNSRDLKTGGFKKESFLDARKIRKGWMAQASNIKHPDDIFEEADAFVVGSCLEEFIKCTLN